MVFDSSLASLLRLAWRIGGTAAEVSAFGQLLRSAFLTEAERVGEEIGRLTAIDGAVVLNRDLALTAFGVILPVGRAVVVEEQTNGEQEAAAAMDFDARGTRHRAAATYAAEHPGSVVFIASEDGQVSCLLRSPADAMVRLWHLDAGGGA
jgi:hypothetical protein